MPAPLVGAAAAAAARLVAKKIASNSAKKTVKATVKKKVVSTKRQAFDTPVSRSSAKDVVPKMGRDNLQISENVAIKNAKSPSGKVSIRGGANQVMNQNTRISLKKGMTKAEAKADARGLKAANKPLSKGNRKRVENIGGKINFIAMDRRPTPPTVAAALKKGPKGSFITEAKKIAMQEARSEGPAKKISSAQKALNKKK